MMLDELVWDCGDEEEVEDMPKYAADFETTAIAEDCRVWAWCACEVGNVENVTFGNDIAGFVKWCRCHGGSRVYFHNLKFDGKFILSHILENGWEWLSSREDVANRTFETLISDMGQWYSIKLHFTPKCTVEFVDSLKIIPLPIAKIPKAFGLPIEKLELDYRSMRERGHKLTMDEKRYIAHDVRIAAMALDQMMNQGMRKITAGSNAFADYKKMIGGEQRFRDWYPAPEYDAELRQGGCYKGGFVCVNPKYAGVEVGAGISFDVNSLYPSVMASAHGELLPYGEPVPYVGEYVPDPAYPLFIQFLEADFKVKDGHIPCLQLKGNSRFVETEYIRDSAGIAQLCLTSVDLALFLEQYEIHDIRFVRGYKFMGSPNLFKDYVAKWTRVKTEASLAGNEGLRTIAKLQLNSLYGKMATNPVRQSREPYLEDGVVKYRLLQPDECEPQYLPVGAFVTAHARSFTVRAAQANFDRWLYCDTDSCYLLGTEPPVGMEVDGVELGKWKQEHEFQRFKAIRAKTYCFEEDGELTVHCAGMPAKCHGSVTMENFEIGSVYDGKLRPVDVKGGIILVEDTFTIKP